MQSGSASAPCTRGGSETAHEGPQKPGNGLRRALFEPEPQSRRQSSRATSRRSLPCVQFRRALKNGHEEAQKSTKKNGDPQMGAVSRRFWAHAKGAKTRSGAEHVFTIVCGVGLGRLEWWLIRTAGIGVGLGHGYLICREEAMIGLLRGFMRNNDQRPSFWELGTGGQSLFCYQLGDVVDRDDSGSVAQPARIPADATRCVPKLERACRVCSYASTGCPSRPNTESAWRKI